MSGAISPRSGDQHHSKSRPFEKFVFVTQDPFLHTRPLRFEYAIPEKE